MPKMGKKFLLSLSETAKALGVEDHVFHRWTNLEGWRRNHIKTSHPRASDETFGWTVSRSPLGRGISKIESRAGEIYVDLSLTKANRAMRKALLPSERGGVVKTRAFRLADELEESGVRVRLVTTYVDTDPEELKREGFKELESRKNKKKSLPEGFGIYLMKFSEVSNLRKIGRTKSLRSRINNLYGYHSKLTARDFGEPYLEKWIPLETKSQCVALEATLHEFFSSKRVEDCNSNEIFYWEDGDTEALLTKVEQHASLWEWNIGKAE